MAQFMKFNQKSALAILRYNMRDSDGTGNPDWKTEKTPDNYNLAPKSHGRTYGEQTTYYQQRLNEVYCMKKKDLITLVSVIVSCPTDVPIGKRKEFFSLSYRFLADRYGEKNVIQSVVHFDEKRMTAPHMHFTFIPVTKNPRFQNPKFKAAGRYEERVCANSVLSINEYHRFHPEFQTWFINQKFQASVYTGITAGKLKAGKESEAEEKK